MERSEIKVGGTYTLTTAGGTAQVRIEEEKWKGDKHTGWAGVDLGSNRKVYINSAARLKPGAPAKAARLPLPARDGEGAAGSAGGGGGVVVARAGSPRPPKGDKPASKGKGARPAKPAKPAKKKRVAPAGTTRKPRAKAEGKMSGLDAAARVLAESKQPMRVDEIVEAARAKGYWESKAGKTPGATVYAAIIREIRDKGADSRFVKKDRGLFAASGAKQ